jgi:hypothetical protein
MEPELLELDPNAAALLAQESGHHVLRNREGAIIATWDEGRWWTPEESEAFTAALVAELRRGQA